MSSNLSEQRSELERITYIVPIYEIQSFHIKKSLSKKFLERLDKCFKTGRNPTSHSKYVFSIELELSMDYWDICDRSDPRFDLCLGAPKEHQNLHFTKNGCNHRFRLMGQLFYATFKLLIIILERFDPFRPPLTPLLTPRVPKRGSKLAVFQKWMPSSILPYKITSLCKFSAFGR